ncbi:MFS transporter [Candidatus Pantoea soli]|uniref:MFS transporter n=1 Tax=Candidatus Pantoea soli TaxID=3098669 RepID=A0A518XFN2_9GAMM|nr:MFS transporter [Pantoea soli]QDY42995.1 MFS transporter [Pantoea soli]
MRLKSLQALCLVSFFLADVRDGLGPFLGIFLTQRHWQPNDIGFVMTAGGLAGLLATLPAGIVTDATRHKRTLLLLGCALITAATLGLWFFQQTLIVGMTQVVSGVAAAFIAPVLAGITLGLTGRQGFNRQMGRNEAFNHAGNMSAAVLAGACTWYWGTGSVFVLMTMMAVFTAIFVLAIRGSDIDHDAARGLESAANQDMPRLPALLGNRALMTTGITLLLFHLANAALLPMLSMRVAAQPGGLNPGLYAAATVVISQAVMIPVALWTSARAENSGYARLILLALLLLPVRAMLAASFTGTLAMVPVQVMDGLAAGILGVAVPGYIVTLLRGTGHVNAGQSAVMLMQGVGAAFSPALTGMIASRYSWGVAFTVLSVIALMALALWWQASRPFAPRTA